MILNVLHIASILTLGSLALWFGITGFIKPIKTSKSLLLNSRGALQRALYFSLATLFLNVALALYYPNSIWLISTLILLVPIWIEYIINILSRK